MDRIEDLDGSTIQHGKYNDRIYLMDIGDDPSESLETDLISLAEGKGYSKIFAKIPSTFSQRFVNYGYSVEARVPGFFEGEEDALFMAYYLDEHRSEVGMGKKLDEILQLARKKSNESFGETPEEGFEIRRCEEDDIDRMAVVYRKVFPSYPFPIHDREYLHKTMRSHIDYFCVEKVDEIIALSSAEKNIERSNVEMTDFATLPEWRGKNLGLHLLKRMDEEMKERGFIISYTIARARSPGMNITFARCDYRFGGRLINNTNISGDIESMNVWYKHLDG